jgi:hypothetical protein
MKLLRRAGPLLLLLALGAMLINTRPASADNGEPAVFPVERSVAVDGGPATTTAQPAQPDSAGSCNDLVADGRELEREIPALEPKGPRGNPLFCLMHYTDEDIYWGVVIRIDGAAHFRAAREDAIRRLIDDGFDVCNIGTWGVYGRFSDSDRLYMDDMLNLPVECSPRVVAADGGADGKLDEVRDAVSRSVEITADQMGWRPNRSLTLIALTDVNAAIATYRRFMGSSADVTQMARDGRSVSIRRSIYGSLILVNLTRNSSSAAVNAFVYHEYTHFAQGGIVGTNDYLPKWFIEGQAVFQESRNTTSAVGEYLARYAEKAQRNGTAVRLANIALPRDWNAQEAKGQDGSDAAYARGFAAVSFLAKRHGFEATVKLLRDNHNGSIDRFNELLADLTGMDLDALDDSVGTWLVTGTLPGAARPAATTTAQPATGGQVTTTVAQATGGTQPATGTQPVSVTQTAAAAGVPANAHFQAGNPFGLFRLDLFTNGDGTSAQGIVLINRDIACGNNRVVTGGWSYTYSLTVQPNGAFTANIKLGIAVLVLDGRFTGNGELRGTMRYIHTDTGCDTGLLPFAGGVQS